MCLEFLDAIAFEWNEAGGPFPGADIDRNRYFLLRRVWYMAQGQFNVLSKQLEVAAGYEKA